MGLEPGAAGWYAQTKPRSYGGHLPCTNNFYSHSNDRQRTLIRAREDHQVCEGGRAGEANPNVRLHEKVV